MRNLFFVTSYNSIASGRDLRSVPSSITYSTYLISAFEKLSDTKVKVLSTSISRKKVYWSKKIIQNGNHEEVYFKSIHSAWGSLSVKLSLLILYFQLFFFLLFRAKKNDVIVIYHEHGLSYFYKIFNLFLPSKLIFVVGEIYSAVWNLGEKAIKKEKSYLMDADGFIFSNDIMPRIFGAEQKSIVCYGSYEYSQTKKIIDNKIHILYAGKISTGIINDAFMALEVIKYLPDNYVMHLAGYGENIDIEELKSRIDLNNLEAGCTRVVYEGNLSGNDYENLLAKCKIGLCTRTLSNELSNYCFPSKTMVYLTHNILPVCPRIDNLLQCEFSEKMIFVEGELSPLNIARAIENSGDILPYYNNEKFIKTVKDKFEVNLIDLVK